MRISNASHSNLSFSAEFAAVHEA